MHVAFTPINWAGLSAVVNWFFVMPKLNCIFKKIKKKKQLKENQRNLMEYVSEDPRGTEDSASTNAWCSWSQGRHILFSSNEEASTYKDNTRQEQRSGG